MSFPTTTQVKKTRHAKRCNWCFERIEKGDPSVVTLLTSGVFEGDFYEGDFYRGRYHPECHAAIERYYVANKCWGEEMPDSIMNRGGILEAGEPEEIS